MTKLNIIVFKVVMTMDLLASVALGYMHVWSRRYSDSQYAQVWSRQYVMHNKDILHRVTSPDMFQNIVHSRLSCISKSLSPQNSAKWDINPFSLAHSRHLFSLIIIWAN
jgi:hypothetical protein